MTTGVKWSDFGSLDVERTLNAVNRLLPPWVALLFVVLIAWQLARLVWMLIPGSGVGDPIVAPPTQVSEAPAGAAGVDVQSIASAHLFGEADAAPAEVAPPPADYENLAETRLNLSLKGTIASADTARSIAIISDAGNDEKVYTLKATVAAGTTLHAIYADRVVLNRGGTLEVLKLPKEFPDAGAGIARRSNLTVRRSMDDQPQSIQNVMVQNASKLADVIRPTPYYVSGEMQGYRVFPGRNRAQFAALGLRPGDLIKDVDGAALTNPQQATEIFQSLSEKDQVSVTVERNGQPEVLVLRTDQLELDESQ